MTDKSPPPLRTFADRLGFRQAQPNEAVAVDIPKVVVGLVAAICVVSIFQFFAPDKLSTWMDYRFGFVPALFGRGLSNDNNAFMVALPLVGHAFLHGGWTHLLLNMLLLVVFGAGVARRLDANWSAGSRGALNAGLFMAFFVACAIAGALTYYFRDPQSMVPMVGASGAISGLMAAAMRFALRPFAPYGVAHGPLLPILSRPVLFASGVYIGINLATALGLDLSNTDGAIAWDAHIGGYVFGLLAFPVFDRLARKGPDQSGEIVRPTFH